MKKVIFTLLSITSLYFGASAQYCGGSGASVCTPTPLSVPGLSPTSDSLPPVVNGSSTPTIIKFKNFNTFQQSPTVSVRIDSLRIDSIGNLPAGLCWATNVPNNQFKNQENGCIKVSGTACSDPGQYKLRIFVTAYTDLATLGPNLDAETVNLRYFVRVKNNGDADVAIDTNQTALFVKHAGYSASITGCSVGIDEVNNTFSNLSVVPNPFSNKAMVSFYSTKAGVVTESLTNMLGAVVYKNQVDVNVGENSSVINRNDLPSGVYFYNVTDGKHILGVKRLVIE